MGIRDLAAALFALLMLFGAANLVVRHVFAGEQRASEEAIIRMLEAGLVPADACNRLPDAAADWSGATTLSYRLCSTGYEAHCTSVGWSSAIGKHGQPDPERALSLLACACSAGFPTGCNAYGSLFMHGTGASRDVERARRLYEWGCEQGSMDACLNLGVMFEDGEGVPQDYRAAADHYQRACDKHLESGCAALAFLLSQGKGVARDPARAFVLNEKACEEDVATACNNLGVSYHNGEGRPKDYARAAALYERSCKGEFPLGCANLGKLYARGHGVARSSETALEWLKQGCGSRTRKGRHQACAEVGKLAATEADLRSSGLSWLRERCRAKHLDACHGWAVHAQERRDFAEFTQALEQTCRLGLSEACQRRERLNATGYLQ